jgi:polyisoprenoid-binding protein YceI
MAQVVYQIDSTHSAAHFSVRHLMVSNVRGEFTRLAGTLAYDAANPANSSLEARVEVASINTRDAQRDTHLKSPDFFDVEKFPELIFRSKQVTKDGSAWKLTGDLTIHGVTHEVTLDVDGLTPEVKDPWGGYRIGASAETKIRRKDFGLNWNMALEAGGVVVGDEVKISIEIEAMRQA